MGGDNLLNGKTITCYECGGDSAIGDGTAEDCEVCESFGYLYEEEDMSFESELEKEIVEKNLTAPRLTPALIDETIVSEQFHVFEGTTLTVCVLTLQNGFTVTGESAAASPENFDQEIGRKIAKENAREKIWALEGYLLKQKMYEAKD